MVEFPLFVLRSAEQEQPAAWWISSRKYPDTCLFLFYPIGGEVTPLMIQQAPLLPERQDSQVPVKSVI